MNGSKHSPLSLQIQTKIDVTNQYKRRSTLLNAVNLFEATQKSRGEYAKRSENISTLPPSSLSFHKVDPIVHRELESLVSDIQNEGSIADEGSLERAKMRLSRFFLGNKSFGLQQKREIYLELMKLLKPESKSPQVDFANEIITFLLTFKVYFLKLDAKRTSKLQNSSQIFTTEWTKWVHAQC